MNSKLQLSAAEARVILLLKKGFTNKKISTELGTSVNTVKYHLKKIFRKLGAVNRLEAICKLSEISGE